MPPGVDTTTLAAPADPADVVAVTEVSVTTTTSVAAVPPTVTTVAPVNPVPVMVIGVPPAAGPEPGVTKVTGGGVGGSDANCSRFIRKGISPSTSTPVLGGVRRVCAS